MTEPNRPRFKLGPLEWFIVAVSVTLGFVKLYAYAHFLFKYW